MTTRLIPLDWLHLQADYDLRRTERENGARIRSKVSALAS